VRLGRRGSGDPCATTQTVNSTASNLIFKSQDFFQDSFLDLPPIVTYKWLTLTQNLSQPPGPKSAVRLVVMKTTIAFKSSILALSFILSCGTGCGAPAEELVKQGDVQDLKLNPTEALKFYLPAEKLEPRNAGILLRIARQYRHQMADTSCVNEKIRLSGLALAYAERAAVLAPKDSEAHLSIAICNAKAIELQGNREKINALRQVKTFADRAISLDSDNDLAWYVLGRWHQRVADMGGLKRKIAEMAYGDLPRATNDDAVRCFRKAISLKSNRSVYYVDLGITYASMGNKDDAKKCIEKGLTLPSTGKDDPETKRRGKETLNALN